MEEEKAGRTISGREVARRAGLSASTVSNLTLGKTRRLDLHVIESLIKYFADEWGREYTLDDLFDIKR